MAHRLADGGQGDVFAPCDAGPSVTRDVCGERDIEIDASADALQFDVDKVCHVLILSPAVPSDIPDYGQDVGRGRRVIFGSSDIWSDSMYKKKKTAEQIVYLNNDKQMYSHEQQFSISCLGSIHPQMHL